MSLPPLGNPLSTSDQRLVSLIADGFATKQIAVRVALRPGHVNNLISGLIQVTGTRNRTHLATTAIRRGWLRDVESYTTR